MTVDIEERIINAVTLEKIIEASKNISPLLQETPLVTIEGFNKLFNQEIFFKLENLQKTGSFKVRGAINALLNLKKNNALPKKIVTYSSGNHGLALTWASKALGVKEVKLYLPDSTIKVKKELALKYGTQLVITKTAAEAEKLAKIEANSSRYKLIPPSDNMDVISGIATVIYEALQEQQGFDAIFIPITGGSLPAGTLLVKNYMSPTTRVYAGSPQEIHSITHKTGNLSRFENVMHTIADGTTVLGITKKILNHVKHLDGIYEISEKEIQYWTAQFYKFTRNFCEPSSALALAAAYRWLEVQENIEQKKMLIIITGSNISSSTQKQILHSKFLKMTPSELNLH